ncbi:Clavaminate synthase-like protein, partial [Microthyrium microscopicum]
MELDESVPNVSLSTKDAQEAVDSQAAKMDEETKCLGCGFFANSLTGDSVDWLQCNGCQNWLHFACANITTKEIQLIDKFYCEGCKPTFGPSTFVRKSARARTNVDYSSLNEGHFSTVEENHEHRYIKAFKNGNIKYVLPETFPRMAPEDITLEYLERLPAMTEPIVVPRALNPRPFQEQNVFYHSEDGSELKIPESEEADDFAQELVNDHAQDKLGMVIPEGLTVRRVAELHGPSAPLNVIDVKSQEGDKGKKWTLGRWADYYESPGDKPIRNVISLEVSYSPMGKLLQRPDVVRKLDLQDAVWPATDLTRKAVKYYVLMSVADCYTDFHIDFGGSSVFYHVLKGKKVFFFVPPTKQNLKKYEDWCISPAQNETFFPDQTKECYRVDLEAGDTMLIPSGWIHSVWTPEDSLVVGGNFLTKLHLDMQLRINELEKTTGVTPQYRYPSFQKVQWYTMLKYLELDPIPDTVEKDLLSGNQFPRDTPIWQEFDAFGKNSTPNPELFNHKYYAKSEIEGWPELLKFIFRTVLISLDRLEGIPQKSKQAVTRSIPKGYGEPLDLARRFACWVAWKRGNENLPEWAYPDAVLP